MLKDEVILALADALAEIWQSPVDDERVEDCARRLDAESPKVPQSGRPDQFSLTAREMKLLALESAARVRQLRRVAAETLGAHTEIIAQTRVAHHLRRTSAPDSPPSTIART